MDFIFIKSSKKGKEDFGSIYARVRTGKANLKVVTGFTIKQLEWEKYRSLQYSSSALMSSIGIKYGQFAQVLARIKTAFEADGFNPKEAKSIIESVKHDVLNGMMQIVEVKPKGRMLFEDYLTSYIEDMELGRRTKKGFSGLHKRFAYYLGTDPQLPKGNAPQTRIGRYDDGNPQQSCRLLERAWANAQRHQFVYDRCPHGGKGGLRGQADQMR